MTALAIIFGTWVLLAAAVSVPIGRHLGREDRERETFRASRGSS